MKFALFLALLLPGLAIAGDDEHNGGSGDLTANASQAASLVAGDTTSFAFGQGSLGDVDISGCQSSNAYTIFIFWQRQRIALDPLCVADRYDQAGKHDLAGQMRCKVPLISELDYTGTTCLAENTFKAALPLVVAGTMPVRDEHDEHDEELVHETAAQLAALQQSLAREQAARRAYAKKQSEQAAVEARYQQEFLQQYKEAAGVVDEN